MPAILGLLAFWGLMLWALFAVMGHSAADFRTDEKTKPTRREK